VDKWTIIEAGTIAGTAGLTALGLVTLMGLLFGRNPGVIGPEVDSPLFDANVDSILDAKLVACLEAEAI
jgi:hypothetical protein